VKVVLTGEGGDEIFGGYPRYAWFRVATELRRRFPAFANLAAGAARALPARSAVRRKTRLLFAAGPDPERHLDWICVFSERELGLIRGPALRDRLPDDPPRAQIEAILAGAGADPIHRMMALDLDTWFPDNILAKVDKMSMAHSLEAREPLLDHHLVEVLGTFPSRLKVRGLRTKLLLKLVARRVLPPSVAHRRKHPFRVPISPWLRGPLDDLCRDLLAPERLRRDGYFNPDYISWLRREHLEGRQDVHRQLWALLCFQLWHAIFITRSLRV
jgi:asparagine synthase (glutamine-hydrolysing)